MDCAALHKGSNNGAALSTQTRSRYPVPSSFCYIIRLECSPNTSLKVSLVNG